MNTMQTLPPERCVLSGRTFSASFTREHAIAIEGPIRRRANRWDRAGWVAAAVLFAWAVFLVYRPH